MPSAKSARWIAQSVSSGVVIHLNATTATIASRMPPATIKIPRPVLILGA